MNRLRQWISKARRYECRRAVQRSRAFLASSLTLLSCVTYASGFRVPGGYSIAGLGMADTLVANPAEAGALAYNPAAMSFHERRVFVAGLLAVDPKTRVTPAGENDQETDNPDAPILVPNLYVMAPLAKGWALGLGINAPFGLETQWKDGTFPAFAGPLDPLEPAKTSLEMFNVNPNVSYRLNKYASLAAGIDYYRVSDATSDTQGVGLTGDGEDYGWNAAFLYVIDRWSFGFSYRSSVEVDIDGEFDARNVLGFKVDSKTELEFPDIFQIGVRYKVNDRIAVEFDIDRTNWSTFDEIVVKSRDSVPAMGIVPGTELARTTNNWRDVNSYHLAMTYDVNARYQLRVGYTLNENPQRESYFSPRYPNAIRHLISAGLKREYTGWDLEGGVLYGRWNDRKVDNDKAFAGGDANGTAVYNGKYEIDGVLFGVGANVYF